MHPVAALVILHPESVIYPMPHHWLIHIRLLLVKLIASIYSSVFPHTIYLNVFFKLAKYPRLTNVRSKRCANIAAPTARAISFGNGTIIHNHASEYVNPSGAAANNL